MNYLKIQEQIKNRYIHDYEIRREFYFTIIDKILYFNTQLYLYANNTLNSISLDCCCLTTRFNLSHLLILKDILFPKCGKLKFQSINRKIFSFNLNFNLLHSKEIDYLTSLIDLTHLYFFNNNDFMERLKLNLFNSQVVRYPIATDQQTSRFYIGNPSNPITISKNTSLKEIINVFKNCL